MSSLPPKAFDSGEPIENLEGFFPNNLNLAAMAGYPLETVRGMWALAADALTYWGNLPWVSVTPVGAAWRAQAEAISLWSKDQPGKFDIKSVKIGSQEIGVNETVVEDRSYCQVLNFRLAGREPGPKILLATPMAGHFANLLEGTVASLLQRGYDVNVIAWKDPRSVPLSKGEFTLSSYVREIISILRILGAGVHLIAVCQPGPAALVAQAAMIEDNDPCRARSMTFIASPLDTRENPTDLNKAVTRDNKAEERDLRIWMAQNLVTTIDGRHEGVGRLVMPGIMQLLNFVMPNITTHIKKHVNMITDRIMGQDDAANKTSAFYKKYCAIPKFIYAHYLLETVQRIFQDHDLPRGTFSFTDEKGRLRTPDLSKVKTPTAAIEGETDEICGVGQTFAIFDICANIPRYLRRMVTVLGAGHYGAFNGREFVKQALPVIDNLIGTVESLAQLRLEDFAAMPDGELPLREASPKPRVNLSQQ